MQEDLPLIPSFARRGDCWLRLGRELDHLGSRATYLNAGMTSSAKSFKELTACSVGRGPNR